MYTTAKIPLKTVKICLCKKNETVRIWLRMEKKEDAEAGGCRSPYFLEAGGCWRSLRGI